MLASVRPATCLTPWPVWSQEVSFLATEELRFLDIPLRSYLTLLHTMGPPSEVFSSWTNVGDVVVWAGTTGNVSDPTSVCGSFIALLGFGAADHSRLFAMMPDSLLATTLSAISALAPIVEPKKRMMKLSTRADQLCDDEGEVLTTTQLAL
eukprot:1075575-Amphidinium_carterae.2